jgi:deoxycytidylate deaminase
MLTDKNFLNIAYEVATGSKCVSRHTGAVIVKDNRILSTGYN